MDGEEELSTVCVACPGWTDKNIPEFYCTDCNDYLCEPCSLGHKETLLFEGHNIESLEEQEFTRAHCPDHPYKFKEYYCKGCKVLGCSACITAHHRQHTVSHFKDYDKNYRAELKSQKTKLTENFHLPIKYELHGCNGYTRHTLEKTKEAMESKIRNATSSVIKQAEGQRHKPLHQLDKNHASLHKRLNAEVLEKKCEGILNDKNPGQLVVKYQKLAERFEALLSDEDTQEMPDWLGDAPIVYYSFTPDKTPISIGSFGKGSMKEFNEKVAGRTYGWLPYDF